MGWTATCWPEALPPCIAINLANFVCVKKVGGVAPVCDLFQKPYATYWQRKLVWLKLQKTVCRKNVLK